MTPWLNVIIWVVLGCLAAVSASSRGRSPVAWFLIGSLLGWYGLLLLFILPSVSNGEHRVDETREKSTPQAEPPLETPKELMPSGEWFFLDPAKTICGPFSAQILKEKWQEGRLLSESWVWSESIVDWKKISHVQPLFDWLKG